MGIKYFKELLKRSFKKIEQQPDDKLLINRFKSLKNVSQFRDNLLDKQNTLGIIHSYSIKKFEKTTNKLTKISLNSGSKLGDVGNLNRQQTESMVFSPNSKKKTQSSKAKNLEQSSGKTGASNLEPKTMLVPQFASNIDLQEQHEN